MSHPEKYSTSCFDRPYTNGLIVGPPKDADEYTFIVLVFPTSGFY
jgi:hypothetical protein